MRKAINQKSTYKNSLRLSEEALAITDDFIVG